MVHSPAARGQTGTAGANAGEEQERNLEGMPQRLQEAIRCAWGMRATEFFPPGLFVAPCEAGPSANGGTPALFSLLLLFPMELLSDCPALVDQVRPATPAGARQVNVRKLGQRDGGAALFTTLPVLPMQELLLEKLRVPTPGLFDVLSIQDSFGWCC